jgi:hypothetical protein
MYDFSKKLEEFYSEKVNLNTDQRNQMRERRDTNRNRLKVGLNKLDGVSLSIKDHIIQGSYKMRTMVQDPSNDYDIDDGVVFTEDDIGDQTPKEIRNIVCHAIKSGGNADKFKKEPEVKDNCVRIYYAEGYHIDIPVYKSMDIEANDEKQEQLNIASKDLWMKSDPREVTNWFNNFVKDKSPEGDSNQARKIVQFLKYKSKKIDLKPPSGLIISKLVEECYLSDSRLDLSFIETVKAISQRLLLEGLKVKHPVFEDQYLTKTNQDQSMLDFQNLVNSMQKVFSNEIPLSEDEAICVWNKIFEESFSIDDSQRSFAKDGINQDNISVVNKEGGGRFA